MKNLFVDMSNKDLLQALKEHENWAFNTGLISQGSILATMRDSYKKGGLDVHTMERDLLYEGAKRWRKIRQEGK